MFRTVAFNSLKVGALIASLALVGCASAPSGRTALPASDLASKRLDSERIARVESAARQSGTKVVWVNPPRKQKD